MPATHPRCRERRLNSHNDTPHHLFGAHAITLSGPLKMPIDTAAFECDSFKDPGPPSRWGREIPILIPIPLMLLNDIANPWVGRPRMVVPRQRRLSDGKFIDGDGAPEGAGENSAYPGLAGRGE